MCVQSLEPRQDLRRRPQLPQPRGSQFLHGDPLLKILQP